VAEAPAGGDAGAAGGGNPYGLLPGLAIIAVLFYFLMIRPERRKQAAHKALLEGLKKNDRVVTIGGMYGVVMNVQRDADEVTIKIDEANNTKVRVTFGAIARVIQDEPSGDKPA
jgi:preprotein translocase subunit YajC